MREEEQQVSKKATADLQFTGEVNNWPLSLWKLRKSLTKFRQADEAVVSLVAVFGVVAQRHHASRDGKRLPPQTFGFIEGLIKNELALWKI